MTRINQRWLLDKRPEGMPENNCWKWEEVDVPELKNGEILIKSLYLSID
ncbi:MAG TPA: NADP-dependent oxidoreductase, partial [Gammaproteobacteria bacterium]|nr:NADP-dependent oxidoreductase [Gammaproteobacteria bacterium]